MKKLLYSIALVLGLFISIYAQGQSRPWFPIGTVSNQIEYVENLDGELYGHIVKYNSPPVQSAHWIICKRIGNVWQRSAAIPLNIQNQINPEKPTDIAFYNGDLYATTTENFYRLDGSTWTLVHSDHFKSMIPFRGKLYLFGNFISINGSSAAGMAMYDGSSFTIPTDSNGTIAGFTGPHRDMLVHNNKLYICGNIHNTQMGTIYSNVITWNDTAWAEGFNTPFPIPEPIVEDLLVWNNEMYVAMPMKNDKLQVYKIVNNNLMPLDSMGPVLTGKIGYFSQMKSQLRVYDNALHAVVTMQDSIQTQSGPSLKVADVLVRYNGSYWEPTTDTLHTDFGFGSGWWNFAEHFYNKIEVHDGRLYGNCASIPQDLSRVAILDTGLVIPAVQINELRKSTCHIDSIFRPLEAMVRVDTSTSGSFYQYIGKNNTTPIRVRGQGSTLTTLTLEKDQLLNFQPSACSDSVISISAGSTVPPYFYQEVIGSVNDVAITTNCWRGFLARHGSDEHYYLDVKNVGTEIAYNLSVQFYHPIASPYQTSTPLPVSATSTNLGFAIDSLYPGETETIDITLRTTSSNYSLGDTITTRSTVNVIGVQDAAPGDNLDTLIQTVIGPYDPNNKLVDREELAQWGGTLDYQINFQNLGSDTAFNVIVVDTLPSHLLPGTFKLTSSSAPVDISLEDHILTFSFYDIALPDSATDEEGSKGYARFKIDMKSNLTVSDTIKNRGHIFFDFQPAVITNYAKTWKRSGIGIHEHQLNLLKIYPNPSKGMITVESPDEMRLNLINTLGQDLHT
ncbi:MAG: hypothetical protein N4A46_14070, partial [Schleiferiaceae bacterium]|nr:hypothetical protein [Schleiferiaceae bacterium]